MYFVLNFRTRVDYSSVRIFNPSTIFLTESVRRVIGDEHTVTGDFANWTLFIAQLRSLLEDAGPADQVVIAFLRYCVHINFIRTDDADCSFCSRLLLKACFGLLLTG